MSFKALTLAASIVAAFTASAFAGSTSAIDINQFAKSTTLTEMARPASMTSEKSSVSTVRGSTVEKILNDCRFVNTKRDTYCGAFNQSNR